MSYLNSPEQLDVHEPKYTFGGCLITLAALGVGYLVGMGLEEAVNPAITEMAMRAPQSGLVDMLGTVVENLPIPTAVTTATFVELVRNIFRR